MLRSLAQQGLAIWGIAYRDKPDDVVDSCGGWTRSIGMLAWTGPDRRD